MSAKNNRKPFFRFIKCIARWFVPRPKWQYVGEKPTSPCIYISNHSAASGPATYELYFPENMRIWGTYEMCGNFKLRWKYLDQVYFHQKKKRTKFTSFFLATILSPILALFYKGMRIIPTFPDHRLLETIKTSIAELENGVSILIFPENSSDGYHEILTDFYGGFWTLAKRYYTQTGKDIQIVNLYYHKKERKVIVGEPKSYLALAESLTGKDDAPAFFLEDTNRLYRKYILGEAEKAPEKRESA